MLDTLAKIALIYVIYRVWRLTIGSVLAWRKSYFPELDVLAEVTTDDLPDGAREYFDQVRSRLEGLGFETTGLLYLKYYRDMMGASAYAIQARHDTKPILAESVWIRFKEGKTMTNPAFSTYFDGNRELLTEASLIGALINDLPGQNRVVFIGEVPLADLLSIHELRLSECGETPTRTLKVPLDPVAAQIEMNRRAHQLGLDCGAYCKHPTLPGHHFSFRHIIRLRWRTSLFIRDLTLYRQKRREKYWLKRVQAAA